MLAFRTLDLQAEEHVSAWPLGPNGTHTVVVVGSKELTALRVAAIARPFSSIST
jgi:hypothetical protein